MIKFFLSIYCVLVGLKGVGQASDSLPKPQTRPKLVIETDQRFLFFNDSRNARNNLQPINVWGGRVSLLLPSKIKVGIGGYYSSQNNLRNGLLPDAYVTGSRRLYYMTVNAEPFWVRHTYFDFSTLFELGGGLSRYRLSQVNGTDDIQRGFFMPAGIGLSTSFKFPPLNWFRPLRWFGVNFLGGYRFTLINDFPDGNVNYNGPYFSIGPIFFFDRFTDDFKAWRQKHKKK